MNRKRNRKWRKRKSTKLSKDVYKKK